MTLKTIGLVLPSAPGYSETFFASKIAGLAGNNISVILFAKGEMKAGLPARQVKPFPVLKQRLLMVLLLPAVLLLTFLRAPQRVRRFWALEKAAGHSMREIAERLYISAHIIPRTLTWLHFGFITQAVRRENVALAIAAKMGVSLRGYDISIYPLTHPGALTAIWPRIDKLHVISDDLQQAAYRQGCPVTMPVVKITPAIDAARFAVPSGEHRSEALKPVELLTVARLHWKKGIEYALEACAALLKQGVSFRYTIVGEGSEYEKLFFMTNQLGLSDYVVFAGKLPQSDIVKIMHRSDIYLQPSQQEGFCNAVLEAQAAGLLCIVSDAEGLPENVDHGKTGWIVPKRNSEAIVACVHSLINGDRNSLEAVRRIAIDRVQAQFTIARQNKSWEHFFGTHQVVPE